MLALESVKQDTRYWKLAILSAHSALQEACVCILTRSDGGGALNKHAEKALWNKLYGESGGKRVFDDPKVLWPAERVADFAELLKRLPEELKVVLPNHKSEKYPFDLAGDLQRLHQFRNMFVHLPPASWNLEVAGLPRILTQAVVSVQKNCTRLCGCSP